MSPPNLQDQCELGQAQLMSMEYLAAQATLAAAEKQAWNESDFDTVARLLLPLQEARRQRRQRCGEGIICLDFIAGAPNDKLDPDKIVAQIPHGQILIAAWGNIQPALRAREIQAQRGLYLDVFLASAGPGNSVEIHGGAGIASPIVLSRNDLPRGQRTGNAETYAQTMSLWERLHAPFLAAADAETDPLKKIDGYRRAIEVDYACELAYQRMADAVKMLK
jgi:hypothetical protein